MKLEPFYLKRFQPFIPNEKTFINLFESSFNCFSSLSIPSSFPSLSIPPSFYSCLCPSLKRSPSWVLDRIAAIEPKKPSLSTSANHHSSPSPHQPDKKDNDDNSMAIPPSLPIRDQGPLADHQTIVNGGRGGGELLPAEKDGEGGKNKIDNQEELKRPPDDPVSTNSMAVGTS